MALVSRRLLIPALVLVAAGVAVWTLTRRPPVPPDAGIPLSLAQDRAARISDLRYQVTFQVPAKRPDPIRANLVARFVLKDRSKPVYFDFAQPADRVVSVAANQQRLEVRAGSGSTSRFRPARWSTARTRSRSNSWPATTPLNRQDDFLYSLFVPARASLAMPVFDQPDLKAKWQLTLNVPPDWTAVSNGRETGRTAARRSHRTRVRGDAADLDLSVRVRGGQVQRRDGGTQRADLPDVPSRDRRREGRPQPRRRLRPARTRARVARRLHGHPVSVRQVRLRPDSVVPVRRHGAPRRDLLQRQRAAAR